MNIRVLWKSSDERRNGVEWGGVEGSRKGYSVNICAGNRSELTRGRQVDDSIVLANERRVGEDDRPRVQRATALAQVNPCQAVRIKEKNIWVKNM